MFYQIKHYIKFLLQSTNQHGVHSPFIYKLITKCFYDKTEHNAYKQLKQYRNTLYKNSNTINITDFGSGSRVFKSNSRAISKIAKTSGITPKRARLLFRVVNYLGAQNILELGTSVGLGTSALHLGNPKAKITTIEGCPESAAIAKQQFESFQFKNIELKISEFKSILSELKLHNYDIIYIDGNHQKEATLQYFDMLLPTTHNNSVFIFDDIHWSEGMTKAWESIKNHPEVTVSIDTFFWGIVFFRKEQTKEHFTIRV